MNQLRWSLYYVWETDKVVFQIGNEKVKFDYEEWTRLVDLMGESRKRTNLAE